MCKGPEVGREHTGRPVKKLGSLLKKALVKQTSCSGGGESGQVLSVFQRWLGCISMTEGL